MNNINLKILTVLSEFYPKGIGYPHFDRLIGAALPGLHLGHPTITIHLNQLREQRLLQEERLAVTEKGMEYLQANPQG